MALLDGFELFKPNQEGPFITVTAYACTFSKQSIDCLHNAPYVKVLFDTETKRMCVIESEPSDDALAFFKVPTNGRPTFVRWNSKRLMNTIIDLVGCQPCQKGCRISGVSYPEEMAIIYDLKHPQIIQGKKRKTSSEQ